MAIRYGKFVDFNDPTLVWRRPGKKRFRISTNMVYIARNYSYWPTVIDLHFAADSMGLWSLVLTQLCLIVEPSEFKTTIAKIEFYIK